MWLAITAIIIGFSTILAISCCESVRHTSPHNLIVLGIFTLAEGYVVGVSTLYADPIIVSFTLSVCAMCPNHELNQISTGFTSRWIDRDCCGRPNDIRNADQMGFHNDGRHSVRGFVAVHFC